MAWLLGISRPEYRELGGGRLHTATTSICESSTCAGGLIRRAAGAGGSVRSGVMLGCVPQPHIGAAQRRVWRRGGLVGRPRSTGRKCMGRSKRHHTVPAFYLKRFADSSGRIERIESLSATPLLLSVRNASVETDYYTVITDGEPSDVIGRKLAEIEGLASEAFRHLDEGLPPSPDDVAGLCNFLALQLTRVRSFRDSIDRFSTDVMRRIMALEASRGPERVAHVIEEATGEKASEGDVAEAMEWMTTGGFDLELHPNAAILSMLQAASPLVDMFAQMRWTVARFEEPVLLTSDNPVTLWAENPGRFGAVGVATADEIALPTSPTTAVVIYPQAEHGDPLGEGPGVGDLCSRTLRSAHKWAFAPPGWLARMQRLTNDKRKESEDESQEPDAQ